MTTSTMGGGPAKEHILCTLSFPEPKGVIESFRKAHPDVEITYYKIDSIGDTSIPKSVYKDATILLTGSSLPEPADAPNLGLVQLFSAGSNQVQDKPLWTDSDIPIATASGVHGPQIAEWVVMTYLVHSHKYKQLYEFQKAHQWGSKDKKTDDYHNVRDAVGMRLGVLGYGSIGRQVARVGKAMGMDVLAFTASPRETPESRKDPGFIVPGTGDVDGSIPSDWYSGLDKPSLHNFLSQDLDILLVSVPLTSQTRHMLSTREFELLNQNGKKPAFVANIARGAIIDQPALVTAIKDGTLRGAALDVTDPEPLPEDSELWDLENVVLTPHVSGTGSAYVDRVFQILGVQVERKIKGEKLLNIVKRERGY